MGKCSSSFLAGFAISIGAYCYSTLSGAMAGAFIFSFGLITIILYGWSLYTGSAGFIKNISETIGLGSTLFFNALGCFAAALVLSTFDSEESYQFISKAISVRSVNNYSDIVPVMARGLFCGFIMTVAVRFARIGKRENSFLHFIPLLLGIPIFLLSGFFHSIVDAFYLSYGFIKNILSDTETLCAAIIGWIMVVIGNFIGCNFIRVFDLKWKV